MGTRVVNLSRGARGFHTLAGTAMVEPGATAVLDLVDHPAHDAWIAAGEVGVADEEEAPAPRPRPPARAAHPRARDA